MEKLTRNSFKELWDSDNDLKKFEYESDGKLYELMFVLDEEKGYERIFIYPPKGQISEITTLKGNNDIPDSYVVGNYAINKRERFIPQIETALETRRNIEKQKDDEEKKQLENLSDRERRLIILNKDIEKMESKLSKMGETSDQREEVEGKLNEMKVDREKLIKSIAGEKGEEMEEREEVEETVDTTEETSEETLEDEEELDEELEETDEEELEGDDHDESHEEEIIDPTEETEEELDEIDEEELDEELEDEVSFDREKVLGNFVKIELPPVKGSKDKRDAYLVVSEHPTKPDGVSLYLIANENIIESSKGLVVKSTGVVLDLKRSEEIFANGGVAVHNIAIDKNNAMRIKYYKGKDDVAKFRMKATDVNDEVRMFVAENYPVEGKVKEVKPTFKARKIVKIAVGVTLLTVAVFGALHHAVSTPVRNAREARIAAVEAENERKLEAENSVKDESAAARLYGASQAQEVIGGKGLFNYVNGKPAARAIDEAVKNKVDIYTQKELSSYEDKNGNIIYVAGNDYTNSTLEGYWGFVGSCAADDLSENGVTLATTKLEGAEAEIIYYYPVSPLTPISKVPNSEEFKANLMLNGGYTSEQANLAIKAYEASYKENVKLKSAENPGIIINTAPTKADYSSVEVADAIVEKLGEGFIPTYISDDAVFAVSEDGNTLKRISITPEKTQVSVDGDQVVTTESLIEAINEGSVDTAVKAIEVLKSIPGIDALSAYEYKGSDVYVSNYGITAEGKNYVMNPTIMIASGKGVEVREGTVTVSSKDKNCNQTEMLAAATFENYWTEEYSVERKEGTRTTYNDNQIGVDLAKFNAAKAESKSSSNDKYLGL